MELSASSSTATENMTEIIELLPWGQPVVPSRPRPRQRLLDVVPLRRSQLSQGGYAGSTEDLAFRKLPGRTPYPVRIPALSR